MIRALGAGFAGITDGREVVTGAGRGADSDPKPDLADGIEDGDPGFGALRGEADSVGLARGMEMLRDSGGRAGTTLGAGVVVGLPEIFGATAVGVPLPPPGRVAGGSVCVSRSVGMPVGMGEGRPGDAEGAKPADGMLAGRFGLSEPPADGTARGRAFGGVMPMRSDRPPEFGVGANRETSGRLRTDSGGREAWVGTAGRYTATSAGRPPEGLGRALAKAWAAAGLLTSRSAVRRISSRLCLWTSSREIALLMITVLLLPRMFTPWPLATWTLLSRTKRSA